MQSTRDEKLHVAIIMDGNGRWATRRGLSRTEGHIAGAETVRHIVAAAPAFGVGRLTMFALSSDNLRRPAEEVRGMMLLLESFLKSETRELVARGIRLNFIGRRDRVTPSLRREMRVAEQATIGGQILHLRIAIDYSSRDAIMNAAETADMDRPLSRQAFAQLITKQGAEDYRDVDLLIRTSGERRLSDFLLWESAYAELWFTDTLWPDFAPSELRHAIDDYHKRDRRYGGLPSVA